MATDCGFEKGGEWFRYRAAAIIIEEGCVLFVSDGGFDYYYSVGGGVHHGETSEQAVLREVYEETGVRYEIDRLAVIHECFWNESDGCGGVRKCHELAFYYLMKPRGTKDLPGGDDKLLLHWVPVDKLGSVKAFPAFLADYLSGEHDGIEIITTHDESANERSENDMDYSLLISQLEAVTDGVDNNVTNLANAAALLYNSLEDVSWAGFYIADGGALMLGPFQGKPACVKIPRGRGVCGAAFERGETVVVPNVHEFEGHIACDAASNSEIVIPLFKSGSVYGVLDIDSASLNRFSDGDREGLERFAKALEARLV